MAPYQPIFWYAPAAKLFDNEGMALLPGLVQISGLLAMSQPALYKKLKALTDRSVNDFIKSVKLNKAAMQEDLI